MRLLQVFGLGCWVLLGAASAQDNNWKAAKKDASPKVKIQSQVGGESKPWKAEPGTSIKHGETVRLKVDKADGANAIRWYQIIPVTTEFYKMPTTLGRRTLTNGSALGRSSTR